MERKVYAYSAVIERDAGRDGRGKTRLERSDEAGEMNS